MPIGVKQVPEISDPVEGMVTGTIRKVQKSEEGAATTQLWLLPCRNMGLTRVAIYPISQVKLEIQIFFFFEIQIFM